MAGCRVEAVARPHPHRPFSIACWRLRHGHLGSRAFLAHVRRHHGGGIGADLCCQAAPCLTVGTVETLTHAFLECPEVVPVIDWMLTTRPQLAHSTPPRSARVLLADDLSGWPDCPADPAALKMWTRLRVAVMGAIWQVRCARDDGRSGESFARRVVHLAVLHLVRAIRRDWKRTHRRRAANGRLRFMCGLVAWA